MTNLWGSIPFSFLQNQAPNPKCCSINSAAREAPPLAWMEFRTRSAAAR